MGKLVVSQFVTVDGVVEDPGGAESFDRGGWAFQFERGPEGDKFKLDEVMAADALLLGRATYEEFAKAWPSREGEFADMFNNMPKVRRLDDVDGSRVEELDRDRRRCARRSSEAQGRARRR